MKLFSFIAPLCKRTLLSKAKNDYQKLVSGLAFLLPFLIYLLTLAPTVTWRDSGEFIAACYTLGIPHPTGYPLYVLLGKLFTFLPVGDVAYRLNLMSAFFAAVTCFLVYHIVLHFTKSVTTALGSALFLAFSFTFWSQALIAEVYSLNAFFLSLLILLLLKWRESKKTSLLYLFALIVGLSFANHGSTIFIVPAALVFIGLVDFKTFLYKAPILFGVFLLGLSTYLYLPIRSAQNPPLDWGNPETLQQFFFHVSAAQYRNLMFSASSSHLFDQLNQFRMAIFNEFTIFGCFLGIIGIMSFIALVKNQPKKLMAEFLLLILIFLADVIYTINFYVPDGQPFYIPSYLIFALWIGAGIVFLLDLANTLFPFKKAVIFPLSALLCLGLPLYALTKHYSYVDLSDFYEASEYGESAFQNLEDNALVFTSYDGPTFVLWYFQHVVYRRKDVTVISMPLLQCGWYLENIKQANSQLNIPEIQDNRSLVAQLVAANLTNHPVYFFFPEEPPSFLQKYKLLKAGPLHRVLLSSAGE